MTEHCHWCSTPGCKGCAVGSCCEANNQNCGTPQADHVPCPLREPREN